MTTTVSSCSTTTIKSSYCVAPPRNNFRPLGAHHHPLSPFQNAYNNNNNNTRKRVPLRNVLPASFTDMYAPEILNSIELTPEGRPSFTQRDIVDWKKNDVRSLLILPEPLPEWKTPASKTGYTIPQIIEPGYRVQILPLDATDAQIVEILVDSDLYKEHGFETQFRVQTAEYTVRAARERQARTGAELPLSSASRPFTKPEWRNIIENYLLNLACEAQCRANFQQMCRHMKRQKMIAQEDAHGPNSSPTSSPSTPPGIPFPANSPTYSSASLLGASNGCSINDEINRKINSRSSPSNASCSPLLKKALLTCLSTSPKYASSPLPTAPDVSSQPSKARVSLSRLEKQQIWVNVQAALYQRLGLNWKPDELI